MLRTSTRWQRIASVGMSGKTYEHAKAVAEAAESEPPTNTHPTIFYRVAPA
jgi:hypothetical protein